MIDGQLAPASRYGGRELLTRARIGLVYLPGYSPYLYPIEQVWAKMKEWLKAKAACNLDALEALTAKDSRGRIRHVGYALS
jgi:transposase